MARDDHPGLISLVTRAPPSVDWPPGVDTAGMASRLVVKVTAGADAPERCAQGLTVAATAAAAGVPVSLWLTGEAAWLAVPGRAQAVVLEHSAPIDELLAGVAELGAVTVCAQCAARRELSQGDLLPGTRIAGAGTFVEEVMGPDVQALVY